ncbi:MAG TPA: hypothetical protein VFE24_13725 [Pirellulales bacterium]|jgi:hypothetical protein|nr:hypothetical protein [Pirellulales bacterium]
MSKFSRWFAVAAVLLAAHGQAFANDKAISPQAGKLEETEAAQTVEAPNFGYVGELGSFQASTKKSAVGMIVVHDYPDTANIALAQTKLSYLGAKRVGNVEGWVYTTEWDGEHYPSKIFFSNQEVYFGGGVMGYIAADYRQGTGWVWKMLPLRRMSSKE